VSTFDNEIIQTGLYISIKIPRPNYRQNFSRAKDTCYYVYLKIVSQEKRREVTASNQT
jgi:hypothetical protein